MCLTPCSRFPCRLYVLWGFVAVATSVTKAAKRKVSHQLIIKANSGDNSITMARGERWRHED